MRSELKERFFTPEELVGYEVVDSEGLHYGVCGGAEFTEEGPFLLVEMPIKVGESTVDVEELRLRLESKGITLPPEAPLEGMVSVARDHRIELPKKVYSVDVKVLKAKVPVSEVKWVDDLTVEYEGVRRGLKVILLDVPREAWYRGIEPLMQPENPLPSMVRHKVVLSRERGILGIAGELVIGFGHPGVRVYSRRGSSKVIRWLPFITWLRRRGYSELVSELSKLADPYKEPKLSAERYEEVRDILKRMDAPQELLDELSENVVKVEGEDLYEDIPWSEVRKVGDFIITN